MTNRDFVDAVYDELSFWSSHFGALLFEHLELRRGIRGLDVACGAGFPLFELAFVHGPSSHFTGLDVWPEALHRARRKIAVYGISNVDLCEADAAAMPFPDESFDLITSNLGINNFADPSAVVAECHRVARPGARIVVTTNLAGHMAELYQVFRETAPQLAEAFSAQEAHRGTRTSVEQLLLRGGFHVSRVAEGEVLPPLRRRHRDAAPPPRAVFSRWLEKRHRRSRVLRDNRAEAQRRESAAVPDSDVVRRSHSSMMLTTLLLLAATLIDRAPAMPALFEARAASAREDFATAAAKMRAALEAVPDDPALLFNLAQVQVRAGDHAAAMKTLAQIAPLGLGFHPDADPAFAELAKEPGYEALLASFAKALPVVEHSKPAFTIAEPDLFPEGLACDAKSGTLYASSIEKRKIVRIAPNGETTDLVAEKQDGLYSVLGMKLSLDGKTIWAAASDEESGRSGLFRFDLSNGKLVEKQLMPEDERHLLNDLDIAPNGDVYATDTVAGTIYRFHDKQREELLTGLPGANGIAFSGDGKNLYVSSSGRGVSVIDMKTKALTVVRLPRNVTTVGIDGLYWHKGSLIGIQNVLGRDRVMRYFLDTPTSIARAEIIDSQHPLFEEPTTGAVCRDAFYYFANTQLNLPPDATLKPIVILKSPLAK